MKDKKRNPKEKFVDDGRVIAPMDGEHLNGYKSKAHRENRRALKEARLSRKERWAIYKGLLSSVLPLYLMLIGSLVLTILLLKIFWIR